MMLPSPKKKKKYSKNSLSLFNTFSFLIHHVDKGAESQSSILANLLLQGNNSQSYIFIFNIDCIYASSKTETEQV